LKRNRGVRGCRRVGCCCKGANRKPRDRAHPAPVAKHYGFTVVMLGVVCHAWKSLHLPQKALKQLRQWWRRLPTRVDSQKEKATPQLVHSAWEGGGGVWLRGIGRTMMGWGNDFERRGGICLELEHANSEAHARACGCERLHACGADVAHAARVNDGFELEGISGCILCNSFPFAALV